MMRREFITLVGGAVAWPLAARAQQERMRRLGLLLVSGSEPLGPFHEALAELGYSEGKNIQIETRSARGEDNLLPELAAYSGTWEGAWGNVLKSRLIVEKIDAEVARVIYAWADHPQGRFKGGWTRVRAQVLPGGKLQ